jgi:MoaA/NifB/PqqE/SkfB family radical SAM enzyme
LLYDAHHDDNISEVMCRSLISVDYRGYVYDCDFNQMLGLTLNTRQNPRPHLRDLIDADLEGNPIIVADHCFGCTAGQGSSCGGALS